MKYYLPLFLALCLFSTSLLAQSHEHIDHEHDHHVHPANEIGVSNNLVYLVGEQEYAYGLHIHYHRTFKESKFGAGLGYEQIFDEHGHKTLGLIGSYRPISQLLLHLSPGVFFTGSEGSGIKFVMHAEATYEFEVDHIHFGPAIGIAYSTPEYHLSIGLHIAFGF